MTMQMSTGAQIKILDLGFRATFEDAIILLFSGTPPIDPDGAVAAQNNLVARAGEDPDNWVAGTLGAAGIDWDFADATGVMRPVNLNDLKTVGVSAGVARWFWIIENSLGSDVLTASTTIARMQGIAAVGGGDLRLSNANFTAGSESAANNARIYFRKGVV